MKETKFKVWNKKNKEWIKPKFGGDLCIGEDVVIVRDFKPNNNGGYSFDKERIFERIDVKVTKHTTNNLAKCPRCGEYQMRKEPGKDSFKQDMVCLACGKTIQLKDFKNYKYKKGNKSMKKLQVAINKVYAFEVENDFDFKEQAEVNRVVEKHLNKNNQIAYNEFYENLEVVCSDCGVSLNEEEKENGICLQCKNK